MSRDRRRPVDLAGKAYWDGRWADEALPLPVDPDGRGLRGLWDRRLHSVLTRVFSKEKPGARILEIGCAGSRWLPCFHKAFGFEVSGLDYSEIGCHQARRILDNAGVKGKIYCGDLFEPPAELAESADIVISFGVVEHFDSTADCLRAISHLAAPGGLVVTVIPNLAGWVGSVQKKLNKPVYDLHVVMDRETLREGHQESGLEVLECDYLLFTGFFVTNLVGISRGTARWAAKWIVRKALVYASLGIALVEEAVGSLPTNRKTSPYILCVARRPRQREV